MKNEKKNFHELINQYIFDKTGKKTGILLSIEAFEEIIEEIEEHYDALLAEAALVDREGAITDEELDELLAKSK